MRNKRLIISAFLLFCLCIGELQAQESINATGGNASGSGGSVSFSVGQMVYKNNTGTNGSEAQGVQQPFEISEVVGVEEAGGISLEISAFPIPTSDFLLLEIANYDDANLSYQLFDMNGKLLESEKITKSQTKIFMSNFVPSTYFLKVFDRSIDVKTFKIVKN